MALAGDFGQICGCPALRNHRRLRLGDDENLENIDEKRTITM